MGGHGTRSQTDRASRDAPDIRSAATMGADATKAVAKLGKMRDLGFHGRERLVLSAVTTR